MTNTFSQIFFIFAIISKTLLAMLIPDLKSNDEVILGDGQGVHVPETVLDEALPASSTA
jgi:hypothetical protein